MSNLSTSWGFVLRDHATAETVNVRVKVPTTIQQWLPLHRGVPEGERCFVSLHEIVRHNAHKLFPGVTIEQATLFRVSRNADIAIEEDRDNSIRELVEEQVRQRRFQPVVRLEFDESPRAEIRHGLMDQFELRDSDVYELPGLLDYTTLFGIASLPVPQLRDAPWTPMIPLGLDAESDLFALIRAGDVLVHHPYESFDASVERFIRDAADDPATTTIKMTVYRLGDDTPFVRSLIKRGRERQAGGLPGRAEGALRRGAQPALGQRAAEGRRPRHLRRAWPQDAHEARAGRAPRGRRAAGATPTSAPATTTSRRRACIRTSGSSPATRRSRATW